MRRLAVLLLLAFATNVVFAQGGKNADTEKKLVENEKQLWQGWQDKKGASFREMLTKDTVGVNAMGITRGAEKNAADIEKGDCDVKSWEIHDPKVDWLDKNTALLTSRGSGCHLRRPESARRSMGHQRLGQAEGQVAGCFPPGNPRHEQNGAAETVDAFRGGGFPRSERRPVL